LEKIELVPDIGHLRGEEETMFNGFIYFMVAHKALGFWEGMPIWTSQ
jgi:hypothetical protein